jgi:hypothetical protein
MNFKRLLAATFVIFFCEYDGIIAIRWVADNVFKLQVDAGDSYQNAYIISVWMYLILLIMLLGGVLLLLKPLSEYVVVKK